MVHTHGIAFFCKSLSIDFHVAILSTESLEVLFFITLHIIHIIFLHLKKLEVQTKRFSNMTSSMYLVHEHGVFWKLHEIPNMSAYLIDSIVSFMALCRRIKREWDKGAKANAREIPIDIITLLFVVVYLMMEKHSYCNDSIDFYMAASSFFIIFWLPHDVTSCGFPKPIDLRLLVGIIMAIYKNLLYT